MVMKPGSALMRWIQARDCRIGIERNAPLVGKSDVGHAGDVGDRRAAERQPVVPLEMRFDESQDALSLLAGAGDVELDGELVV